VSCTLASILDLGLKTTLETVNQDPELQNDPDGRRNLLRVRIMQFKERSLALIEKFQADLPLQHTPSWEEQQIFRLKGDIENLGLGGGEEGLQEVLDHLALIERYLKRGQ
jgi:hypothetical protein